MDMATIRDTRTGKYAKVPKVNAILFRCTKMFFHMLAVFCDYKTQELVIEPFV